MQPFSFVTTAQIISEAGAARRLASICQARGARRVLIVTDPGIARLGLFAQVIDGFPAAQVDVSVFHDVSADPSQACVLAAVASARQVQAELIIGFGGGSSMDVAKLVAVLAHPQCSQSIDDLYGIDRVHSRRLPLIQAPTTAGTGSEVTPIAIVTVGETSKTGIVSPVLLPDLALLDAACTLGLPPAVTAATGIDAMVHAIEAYTSKLRRNPLSSILAREALRLLSGNLEQAVHGGSNLEARQGMLLGACQPVRPSPTHQWRRCMRWPIRWAGTSTFLMGCRTRWCSRTWRVSTCRRPWAIMPNWPRYCWGGGCSPAIAIAWLSSSSPSSRN